ncbi:MAG: 3-deoxy-7-phosphoheptulonate synthase [Planctomycetota bacterium]|jgi:3-deoxy-7-phosphoheptulonate synthase
MSRAGIAAGANGLIVEAHTDPTTAYTDAQQTVDMATIAGIVADMAVLATLDRAPADQPAAQRA